MLRSFIAVELPGGVRDAIRKLVEQLSSTPAGVRWVSPDSAHLTLKFLGDVDQTEIHRVCRETSRAVHDLAAFEVQCVGVGAFPDATRPRTVWVGIADPDGWVAELQSRVEQALRPLGFAPERRAYHPHLTLGRMRYNRRGGTELTQLIRQYAGERIGTLSVDEVVVFSSQLTPRGPIHTSLAHCPLAG